MVIEGTRCHASSRLRCDWHADCHARVGCRRPVSARQVQVIRRSDHPTVLPHESRPAAFLCVRVLSRWPNARCPLWVISGHRTRSAPCPLYPRKRTSPPSILAEHPSAITDDLVARSSGITGVAQRQASGFQVATVRFDKKASDWEVATRLPWAQAGPVTIFYGRSGRHIQAPGGLITEIVRQVGADNEQ